VSRPTRGEHPIPGFCGRIDFPDRQRRA
jgi:hypothetical protein